MTQTIKFNENTYIFDEGGVRFFLLVGGEKALMVDCGMNTADAKALAAEVCSLPTELILTHADRDHTACIGQFDWFYMHPAEAANFYNTQKSTGKFVPVEQWDIIDLGGRKIEIISTPGHTPGSIALLDEAAGFIITGDPIQDGKIFMFGPQREMHAYLCGLLKVKNLSDRFVDILPSHGSLPLKADIIDKLYRGAERVLSGDCPRIEEEIFGRKIARCDVGCASFLVEE